MFWHPIILTQQMSPVGWLHYKSSLTGGRDALPQRVLARTSGARRSFPFLHFHGLLINASLPLLTSK